MTACRISSSGERKDPGRRRRRPPRRSLRKATFVLARLDANGSFDPSLGSGVVVRTATAPGNADDEIFAALQSDAKLTQPANACNRRPRAMCVSPATRRATPTRPAARGPGLIRPSAKPGTSLAHTPRRNRERPNRVEGDPEGGNPRFPLNGIAGAGFEPATSGL
jgi:hypothetical protein